MKKKWILILLIINLSVIFSACDADQASDDVTENKVPITTATVKEKDVNETFLSLGRIEAATSVTVKTGGIGTVEKINIKAGDEVKKGDTLFTLDKEDLKSNLKLTESQLRTNKENLQKQFIAQKEQVNKNEILYENNAIAKNVLDQSIDALEQLENQYEDALINYNTQVENLRDDIESRNVKSPIDGEVAALFIEKDESVQSQKAVEIINDDEIIAITDVTAGQINQLEIDGKVIIYPDGKSSSECIGNIVRFNQIPKDSRGLYEVEINVCNKDGNLRTGEYVEAYYIVDQRKSLMVPKSSIKKIGEDSVVYVVKDEKVEERIVKLGITKDSFVEILEGLKEGEEIAIRGSSYLKDGDLIKIIE